MKQEFITEITQQMLPYLDNMELEQLQKVLKVALQNFEIIRAEKDTEQEFSNLNFMELFLSAKRVEGCSEKTLKYYRATIETMLTSINGSMLSSRCSHQLHRIRLSGQRNCM